MAVGNYGITRPADVDIDDIDVFYSYMKTRSDEPSNMIRLNSDMVLDYVHCDDDDGYLSTNPLEGMYNLKLPSTIFDNVGIYNIYLKPKTIEVDIEECGVLANLPNILGLILDKNKLPSELTTDNALQGYRVEYTDSNINKKRNIVRYVVSSNGARKDNGNQYVFDSSSSLIFLQLTPSSSFDVKPNIAPYIGNVGERVLLSNTYFNPLMVEVEMVEDTIETIVDLIAGEQVKDTTKGIVTYYDREREITKQFDVFQIKDEMTNTPLYEVKKKRDSIDKSQSFEDIISDIV